MNNSRAVTIEGRDQTRPETFLLNYTAVKANVLISLRLLVLNNNTK